MNYTSRTNQWEKRLRRNSIEESDWRRSRQIKDGLLVGLMSRWMMNLLLLILISSQSNEKEDEERGHP